MARPNHYGSARQALPREYNLRPTHPVDQRHGLDRRHAEWHCRKSHPDRDARPLEV